MKCINKSSKEFKKLMKDSGYSEIALAVKIGQWQTDNNSDEFPTLAQVLGVNPGTLRMFGNDSDYEQIGSPQQYSTYENTVENPTKEGFLAYVGEIEALQYEQDNKDGKPSIIEKLTSVKHSPSSANLNFDVFREKGKSVNKPFVLDSQSEIESEVSRVYFNGKSKENVTISDLVTSMRNNFDEALSETSKIVMDKILKLSDVTGVNLEILPSLDFAVKAQYDSGTNTIKIPFDTLVKDNPDDVLTTVLHEIVHAKTVGAIAEPKTAEEIEVVESIKTFIKEHGKNSESYGFTDVFEFVAEFYSNSDFKREVFEIFNKSKQAKTLFGRIMDAIRRLFGVRKPSKYDNFMETVMFLVDGDVYSKSTKNHGVFNLNANEKIPDFTTIQGKFQHVTNVILDSLEKEHAFTRHSRAGKNDKADAIENIKARIELVKSTESYERMKVITSYVKDLHDAIMHKNSTIQKMNVGVKTKSKDLQTAKSYTEFLAITDFIDVVEEYANSVISENKGNKEFVKNELPLYKEVVYYISQAQTIKKEANAKLLLVKKGVIQKLLSNPDIIGIAETKMREKLAKEYATLDNPDFTENQYFIKEMAKSARRKEINELAKAEVESILNNPHADISNLTLNFSDPSNKQSKIIDGVMSLLAKYKDNIIGSFRRYDALLSNKYDALVKSKGTNNVNKLNEKIYTLSTDGVMYLTPKYRLDILESYNKLYGAVNERLFGNYKVEKITDDEKQSLKESGLQFLFRPAGTITHVKDDLVNLRNEDKASTINIRVSDVKTIKRSEMKDDEFLAFVQNFGNFKTIEEFEEAKLFATEKTAYSRTYPEVYKFMSSDTAIDVMNYTREYFDIDFDYNKQLEFTKWIEDHSEVYEAHDPVLGIFYKSKRIRKEFLNPEYTNMSKEEKELLTFYERESVASDKAYGGNSLTKKINGLDGVNYYRVPSHSKSNIERRTNGDFKGMIRDKIQFLKGDQDEQSLEYGEAIDARGNIVRRLKPHYRGRIDEKDQSRDLATIYRKEAEQRIKHSFQKKADLEISAIVDIMSNKDYIVTQNGSALLNKNAKHSNVQTVKGHDSNEVKNLKGIQESFVYDILTHSSSKIGNVEWNKIGSLVNGGAASIALTLNGASGVANILNGMTQLHLDAIGGLDFNLKDLKEAEARYTKDMSNIAADLMNPNKKSFTNQMLLMFNVTGGLNLATQDYLRNNVVNSLMTSDNLNMFNESGEHMMSSILTYAILSKIKVYTAHGTHIDKVTKKAIKGKDEKNAASLLDMLEMGEDGLLTTNKLVHYTSHAPSVNYQTHGRHHISMLIKKRSHDLFGAYDPQLQGEIMKKWYGKSLMMFKRFFIPGLQHRYRGFSHIMTPNEEMGASQLSYNNWTRRYEEGYYVTLAKMLIQSAKNIKTHGLSYMPTYYNSLSKMQKANLRKATAELILTWVFLPILGFIIGSAAGDDDDKPYFMLYQINRLSNELGTFYNPMDFQKIAKNPVAGLNFFDKISRFVSEVATPINISPEGDDSYFDWLNSDGEGNNKIFKTGAALAPGISRYYVEYKDLYNQFK